MKDAQAGQANESLDEELSLLTPTVSDEALEVAGGLERAGTPTFGTNCPTTFTNSCCQ